MATSKEPNQHILVILLSFLVFFVIFLSYGAMQHSPVCQLKKKMPSTTSLVAAVPENEMLLLCGGEHLNSFEDIHGGHEYDDRNQVGLRLPDVCVANQLAMGKTFFKKNSNRLITYSRYGNYTQVDYLL